MRYGGWTVMLSVSLLYWEFWYSVFLFLLGFNDVFLKALLIFLLSSSLLLYASAYV